MIKIDDLYHILHINTNDFFLLQHKRIVGMVEGSNIYIRKGDKDSLDVLILNHLVKEPVVNYTNELTLTLNLKQ